MLSVPPLLFSLWHAGILTTVQKHNVAPLFVCSAHSDDNLLLASGVELRTLIQNVNQALTNVVFCKNTPAPAADLRCPVRWSAPGFPG